MENVLFLQSDVRDPFDVYARMRAKNPVYYDQQNKIWAIYKYNYCEAILNASQAQIPSVNSIANKEPVLNEIITNLTRLNNGVHHTHARTSAIALMKNWNDPDVPELLHILIGEPRLPSIIEWVNSIAKRLPSLALLRGFGFPVQAALSILPEIENLVKLMTPAESDESVVNIKESVRKVRGAFDSYVLEKLPTGIDSTLYAANFIGLLIQSYDATRGLLSNSLLTFLQLPDLQSSSPDDFLQLVKETSRLNPTVHNTRRIIQGSVKVGDHKITDGEQVLIVLAAANHDPEKFSEPDSFKTGRAAKALSFGAGIHKCIAEDFSINLTTSLLYYLFTKYFRLEVLESGIEYEPRVNVRIPKRVTLMIS